MIGKKIQEGWHYLASKHGLEIDVGGIPPLSHFSFKEKSPLSMKALFVQLMLERGFLASTLFYSMYAHQTQHVEKYLKAVDESFAEISELNQMGEVEKRLKGMPATEGFKRLT
jgi:hypothetical protein